MRNHREKPWISDLRVKDGHPIDALSMFCGIFCAAAIFRVVPKGDLSARSKLSVPRVAVEGGAVEKINPTRCFFTC